MNTETDPLEETLTAEFATNPEPRMPCVLLVDTSDAMSVDGRIDELNEGLRSFVQSIRMDRLMLKRVEVAVVAFGGEARLVSDFTVLERFAPPTLSAQGEDRRLAAGMLKALDLINERKAHHKANGVAYYCPFVIMITSGLPKGEDWQAVQDAVQVLADEERRRSVKFLSIAFDGTNMTQLDSLVVRQPYTWSQFWGTREFTRNTLSFLDEEQGSRSEQVALLPPGWGAV